MKVLLMNYLQHTRTLQMKNKSKFQNVFDTRSKSEELQTLSTDSPKEKEIKKVGRPSGKRSDDKYRQVTLLMKKETIKKLKSYLLEVEEKKDLSELIDDICETWLEKEKV